MDVSRVTSNMRETQICKPINTYGSVFTGSRTPDLLQGTIKGWAQGSPTFRDPFSPHLESGLQSSWFTLAEHPLKALPICAPTVSEEWTLLMSSHLEPPSKLTCPIGAGFTSGGPAKTGMGLPLERASGAQ